ncbi:MAG TPA: lytic transglycosylase F [Pseudolabrys sp.]|nr:lytic transglycosylase F [Pseudolabrys sp.]
MRPAVAMCALLLAFPPAAALAETPATILSLPDVQPWRGDLDGMLKRRVIRILVVPSKTFFFLNKGETQGLIAETGQEFEKWINKRHAKGPYDIKVEFVPTRRDRIFQALIDGKGDIAAANLTVTSRRSEIVDFPKAWLGGVKEILVTGPSAPAVATIFDLGGREIMVRKSSSYHAHLLELNERLNKDNRPAVKIVPADEALEDEDLLEMVSAGLLPWAIVDSHKARLWSHILKGLSLRDDIAFNQNGEISWAIRKNSPQLHKEVEEFVTSHRKFVDDLVSQYLFAGNVVRNALAPADVDKFHQLVGYFQTYGARYSVDPYMLAAQGYQESSFNQKLRMKSGAVGVMQMMESTARTELGINDIVTRAEDNIHSGAKYLRYLVDKYLSDPNIPEKEKVLMTLAAYNAGPSNLQRFRKKAQDMGFNPNIWFGNVEHGAAAIVGQETVQYVGNIQKYFIVYSTLLPRQEATGAVKSQR